MVNKLSQNRADKIHAWIAAKARYYDAKRRLYETLMLVLDTEHALIEAKYQLGKVEE